MIKSQKKVIKYSPLYILLLLNISCNQNEYKTEGQLNNINLYDAKCIQFINIIEDIQLIKLENKKGAFFNDCWKIRMYKDYIYIYSLSDFGVYIFDKNGKFINRLVGYQSEHLTMPTEIEINKSQNELWIINDRRTVNRYDLQGKSLKGVIKLPFETASLINYSKNQYLLYDGNFNRNVPGYIGLTSLNANSNVQYFATKNQNLKFDSYIPATLFTKDNSDRIFTLLPHNDTIYISEPRKNLAFRPYIHLDFNGNLLNHSNWPEEGFTDKSYAKMIQSKKYVYNIHSFYYASSKLFFKTQGKQSKYFFIDIQSKQLYSFTQLVDNLNPKTPASSIQGSKGNRIFFIFEAKDLIDHYKNTSSNYPKIVNFIKSLNKNDNKVILICSIKS